MSVPTCDHLKEDGVYCGSPALKDRNYCYFHLNLHGRRLKAARARRRGDNPPLNLPFPEDMHSVQVCLAEIMWAVAEHRIDRKDAYTMLYSLQQASTNLNRTPGWEGAREAVPATRPLRALSDPNFEQRHGLSHNIDLSVDPAAAPPDEAPMIASSHGVILSEEVAIATDESKDPFVSAEPKGSTASSSSSGGPQLPDVGNCGNDMAPAESAPEIPSPSDRVPLPEAELQDLNMTQWEDMEFFTFKFRFPDLTDEQEQQLRVAWLRQKRRLTREQIAEAQRDGSEALIVDDGSYDPKQVPFGFFNTIEALDEVEEAKADQAA